MAEVFIVDRVVTAPPGCAQTFIDSYLSGYAPAPGTEAWSCAMSW